VLNLLQKPDVMFGQSVGSCAVPQQHNVAQRWLAIDLLALSHICDRLQALTLQVFDFDDNVSIAPPRHSLRQVQAYQIAPCDPVNDAPDLRLRVAA
jgi:hypothetical protein